MKNIDDIKKIAKKCLNCKNPSCVKGCPIENPIPEVLKLVLNDEIDEACKVLFANTNGSAICSRLCDINKQCFKNCILTKKNGGVNFSEVEKYLSEYYDLKYLEKSNDIKKEKVAIIGGGISGISTSIDLSKLGYRVTIFEKTSYLGGVIKDSLPEFRFNSSLMSKYEDILKALDIKVEYNKDFGNNLVIDDLKDYKFVILAMGTYLSKSTLSKHTNVLDALTSLELYKQNRLTITNKKVLVIGGGNIALDVARVLKRLNNDVNIVYRRDIDNSPASKEEIMATLKDGVIFRQCLAPIEIILNDNKELTGLRVEKMNLVKDVNSTRLTFEKTGEYLNIDCDYIVEAIGLNADYIYTKLVYPELFNEKGWIDENKYIIKDNQVIMATGDYLTGASSFVNALRSAKNTVKVVKDYE